MSRHKITLPVLFIFLPFFVTSCKTTTSGYFADRLNDTIDMIPLNVAAGPGFYIGARATAFAGVGIGYDEAHRAGWHHRTSDAKEASDLRGFKSWHEREMGLVVLWSRTDDPSGGAGNVGFVVPVQDREFPFKFRPHLDAGSALDAEVTIHLGIVGFRIGASPIQAIDWLLGWTTLDVLNDDLNARFYNTREEKPEKPGKKSQKEEKSPGEKKIKKSDAPQKATNEAAL